MSGFAVIRHPGIAAAGIIPAGAYELKRYQGWYRVSDWRDEPSDFHLPDFPADSVDLDAPPPEPEVKPRAKSKREPEPQPEEEEPETPAEPETDEEQA